MKTRVLLSAAIALGIASQAGAATIPLTFTKLIGDTGGNPAQTAVYRAKINANTLTQILSIRIRDNSSSSAGADGQFTGFDLDGIKLSTTSVSFASTAKFLGGLNVFNFGAGTTFTPGTQDAPFDAKLFGTTANGLDVNNTVATLGAFDGNSTTNTNPIFGKVANGFVSLGLGGQISFNLTSPVANNQALYLYVGEVGDNGELLNTSIEVSDQAVAVPVPASAWMGLMTMAGLVLARTTRRRVLA